MIKNNYNNKYVLNILKKEGWFRYKNAFSKKITDKLKLEIRDNEKKYIEIQKKSYTFSIKDIVKNFRKNAHQKIFKGIF